MPPVIPDLLPPADSPETCVAIMAATPDSERTHVTRGQGGHLDTETGRPPPGSTVCPTPSITAYEDFTGNKFTCSKTVKLNRTGYKK